MLLAFIEYGTCSPSDQRIEYTVQLSRSSMDSKESINKLLIHAYCTKICIADEFMKTEGSRIKGETTVSTKFDPAFSLVVRNFRQSFKNLQLCL